MGQHVEVSNTIRRSRAGTKGRCASVDTLQMIVVSAIESGTSWSLREDDEGDDKSCVSSGSVHWALAIAVKSTSGGPASRIAFASTLDNTSATALFVPLMCLISVVNWEIKSRWRACLGEYLSARVDRENVRSLYSVLT